MIRAGVDLPFAARADDVTRAVLVVAKKRAAAMHAFFLVRLGRIEWRIRTLGIVCDAAFVGQRLVVIRAIPITTPLPHITGHVVETVTVDWKTFNRRDVGITQGASSIRFLRR